MVGSVDIEIHVTQLQAMTVLWGMCSSRPISPCDIDLLRPSILPLSQSDNSLRDSGVIARSWVLA